MAEVRCDAMRDHARVMFLAVVLPAVLAVASDEEDRQRGNEDLASSAQELNTSCGTKVAVTYDWASEGPSPGKPAYQGPIYCQGIIKNLTSTCTDTTAKAALVESIKSVRCRLEPGASKKVADGAVMTMAGTTLTASYDWNSSNLESEAYTWLTKRLLTPGPNGPVTVEARKEKADGEQQLADAVTVFQEKCGAKVAVTYDFSSEKGHAAKPAWQGSLYCKQVLEGLAMACEIEKAKVGKKLKAVACRFEEGVSKKKGALGAMHTLKGDSLTASYDWESGNLADEARKWAASKLK